MPLPATLVDTQAAAERLPYGQAIDTYLPWNYVPTQGDTNPNRWLAGVTFVPRGCPTITVTEEDPCVTMTWTPPAGADGFDDPVTFLSFRMEKIIECSSVGGFTDAELEDWVTSEARTATSYALARHAWGDGIGSNADFRDQADDVTTAADLTPLGALAAVTGGLARRLKGQRGMVHMSPDMLVRLKAAGALMHVGDTIQTPNGHTVVADAGYDGSGPAGLQLGNSYIYGTGPVFFKLTPLRRIGEPYEDFDRVHNDMTVRVEQRGIVIFEPCPVVVARSSVATSNV